jgi:diaminopimelate decarboxylase
MLETKGSELFAGGFSVVELVEKHSEPIYIYDGETIEERCRRLQSLLPADVGVLYSLKANPNPSIAAFVSELVFGADVSSLAELCTALRAGFAPDRIFFVGPSKSREEIRSALQYKIGCVIAESELELEMLNEAADEMGAQANVGLRVNPAFDASGSKLKMGGAPRQFGIDEENVVAIIRNRARLQNLSITGLHAYLGTRILDWKLVLKNTEEILRFAAKLAEETGLDWKFVDVGGGLGIPYFPGESEFDLEQFAAAASELFARYRQSMPNTRFLMEMGRYLTAESGIYVTRVRYVKESRGQKYVLVSGGMNHHQATTSLGSLVKQHFPIVVANKMALPAIQQAFICGPLCTPNDVLGKSVGLPEVKPGDLIAIMKSGAYGFTASPLMFISHPWPGEVLVYKGTDHLIRDPQEMLDVLRNQKLVRVNGAVAV